MSDTHGHRGDGARPCRDAIASRSRQRRDAVATVEDAVATVTRHVAARNPTNTTLFDP
jgi:hypothetical protein